MNPTTKRTAFEVLTDDDPPFNLNVRRAVGLMGVVCPSCNTWAMSGIEYPSIDPGVLDGVVPAKHLLLRHHSRPAELMPLETFIRIRRDLEPILGPDRPIMPSMGVGPLYGNGRGRFTDFMFLANMTPLLRASLFNEMCAAGFQLNGVPANLKLKGKSDEHYVELDVLPSVRLKGSPSPLKICSQCDRVLNYHGKDIDGATFDPKVPLQRIREWPTRILANEAFARFVEQGRFSGIEVREIQLD